MSLMTAVGEALVRKVTFPLWTVRDHPKARHYIHEFDRTQFLPPAQLRALQLERLQKLIAHAYKDCRFYRERMEQAGLRPSDVTELSVLRRMPRLTKKDLQTSGDEMLAQSFPAEQRLRNQTGGSTGSPVQFYVDKERFTSRMASTLRHNAWAGYRAGDWCAHLWGARMDLMESGGLWNRLRKHLNHRMIELNTSSIGEEDWQRFIAEVRSRRPRVMLAYAQSAVLFAKYAVENGITDLEFPSMITTSEVLLPEQRQLLETTFRGKVFNRYGSREVSVVASECEHHRGMHVNADALLMEIVPEPGLAEGCGRILITDLLNHSMPLIRYEIGDVGRWAEDQSCPCGRGLPLLAALEGRVTDFLVLRDGRHLSGVALLTWVFASMPQVRQVQFVQRSAERILLRVVPGKGYSAETPAEIRARMAPYLKGMAEMEFEEVAAIPSEASGKYRFVLREEVAKGANAGR